MSALTSLLDRTADILRGHASLKDRRILVVEDDAFLALDLEIHLEAEGVSVLGPVRSLAEATSLLALAPQLDSAVLDVNLGGETVYPLADVLMAQGLPIVFVTGQARRDIPERFREVPVFEKPLATPRLARALREMMTGRSAG